MFIFILRRLLGLPLVLFGVTLLIVLVMQFLSPEQRATAFITNENQGAAIQEIIKARGLDQPFHIQYWSWLTQAFQGNLGYSRASNQPVWQTIASRFPATLELAFFSILPVIGIGIWIGTLAGLNKDKVIDKVTRVGAVIAFSLPSFVLGLWLTAIFWGALNILPGIGQYDDKFAFEVLAMNRYTSIFSIDALLNGRFDMFFDAMKHLILPTITLTAVITATIIKTMRNELLEVLNMDYVRTARAKGLSERVVHLKHARRNAMISVATVAGAIVVGLLNGVVITETIFNFPGVGSWGAKAATQLDYPGILGFALLSALLVAVGNLLVDVMYAFIDPRVRFD
jgi:ABC-type dipeptide/oligopeptide/nickel transport system permease component